MKRIGMVAVCVMCAFAACAFAAEIDLGGIWRLDYLPQPDSGAVRTLEIPKHQTVEAMVPGNCELDLVQAGILPVPEVGLNALQFRPYEGYQWLYTKTFEFKRSNERAWLVFEGIDTLADVFLNGEKIGETENMLLAHRFDVTDRLRKSARTSLWRSSSATERSLRGANVRRTTFSSLFG